MPIIPKVAVEPGKKLTPGEASTVTASFPFSAAESVRDSRVSPGQFDQLR
jgi:hypothetical protein